MPDPAYHAASLTAAAAQHDADTWVQARIPFDGTDLDGAIVELQLHPDGIFTGSVRIPGPPQP